MHPVVPLPISDDPNTQGTLVLPAGVKPVPAVVVIHDITGFRDDTIRHCERFAAAGYAALAPDLFKGGLGCVVRSLLSSTTGDGRGMALIAAARAFLDEHPRVDNTRIGISGFCMGGGFALLAAADGSWTVAAPFYGTVPRNTKRLAKICPTIAQYGGRDLIFRGFSKRLGAYFESVGGPHQLHVHPDAGHSFMNDHPDALFQLGKYTPMRAEYSAETEEKAWGLMMDFFAEHMPA